tara:strand:- start:1807 stop:2190 length:384 start_codon:yes stop_codon:yes gene_type:complete
MAEPAIKDAGTEAPTQLPEPVGWRILIGLVDTDEKTTGGVIKPDDYRHVEQVSSIVGVVLKMGPLCYQDSDKFGEEMQPWCKKGDCVLIPPFAGNRLVHKNGQEFRLINDDTVQGVVDDPRGWRRAV